MSGKRDSSEENGRTRYRMKWTNQTYAGTGIVLVCMLSVVLVVYAVGEFPASPSRDSKAQAVSSTDAAKASTASSADNGPSTVSTGRTPVTKRSPAAAARLALAASPSRDSKAQAVSSTDAAKASTASSADNDPSTVSTGRTPVTKRSPTAAARLALAARDKRKHPFFCAAGNYASSPRLYPRDGLCDVIFYTHVYILEEVNSPTNPASYEIFLNMAQNAQKTEYGLSFHAKYLALTMKDFADVGKDLLLRSLYGLGIRHHGILNFDGLHDEREDLLPNVTSLLKILKTLQTAENKNYAKNPNFLVLGTKIVSQNTFVVFNDYRLFPADLTKYQGLAINVLLVNTAMNTWPTSLRISNPWCYNDPPTVWQSSTPRKQSPQFYSTVLHMKAANISKSMIVLFGFTMIVKLYTMPAMPTEKHAFNLECKTYSVVPYSQICDPDVKAETDKATKTKDEIAFASAHPKLPYYFTWDTGATITEKMRKVLEELKNEPVKNFGFIMFDVEYEEPVANCSKHESTEDHPRISIAREFVDTL
ncbi:uncharacterized protein LOC135396808 isoform X2 [Ornithodoros turicata]|uniref:uncharacterized protein LOC135396808 isoform X2 n=1 Tax=Ornithodoros turicata TaxID=34597 RepID=UPI003138D146